MNLISTIRVGLPAALTALLIHSSAGAEPKYPDAGLDDYRDADTPSADEEEEEEESPTVGILFDPAGTLLAAGIGIARFGVDIQVGLDDYVGLDIYPSYVHTFGDWAFDGVTGNGGGAHLGLRIAPMGTGLRGMYLVPRVGVHYARASSGSVSLDSTQLTPSVEVGYSWVWGHFIMNLGGGAGYSFHVGGEDIYDDAPLKGLQLIGNFSIGAAL